MADTLLNRVRRGARLIDERLGRSALRRVRIRQLNMDDCEDCVLGQLYGDFVDGAVALDLDLDVGAARYGFAVGETPFYASDHAAAWERLDELWADEIRARRG